MFINDGIVQIGVFARIEVFSALVNMKLRELFLQRRLSILLTVAWLSNTGGVIPYVHP